MKIGIIGAGAIGSAFAAALSRARVPAILSNRRGPESLAEIVSELDDCIVAGTRAEAADAEIVLVAVNWSNLPEALGDIPDWGGRIAIDANNPVESPNFKTFELNGRTSSEIFSELVPGARVVKAFNHLQPHLISRDPAEEGGRRVLFLAGDDDDAKAKVKELTERLGFYGIDLGSLREGGQHIAFPGGSLTAHNLCAYD